MNKVYDLNNKEVKVGDRVVVGQGLNNCSYYLVTGKVSEIEYKNVRTTLTIELEKVGCWGNNHEDKNATFIKVLTYQIPREHCNIMIV